MKILSNQSLQMFQKYFLRQSLQFNAFLISKRQYTAGNNLKKNISISFEKEKEMAVISMHKSPVNSLNLEFLNELVDSIRSLASIEECKGFILTSKIPHVFSAGLDINEMYKPDIKRFSAFWRAVQDMWITLYGSSLISVAAITGNAPGAGCILAMSCDFRIMLNSQHTIGISGTRLGMISPWWFQKTFKNVAGPRETELALTLGKSYLPKEAIAKGLVDELASSPAELMIKAEQQLKKWIRIPNSARQATKENLRRDYVKQLVASREDDIASYIEFVTDKSTQKAIGDYLEALKQKSKVQMN